MEHEHNLKSRRVGSPILRWLSGVCAGSMIASSAVALPSIQNSHESDAVGSNATVLSVALRLNTIRAEVASVINDIHLMDEDARTVLEDRIVQWYNWGNWGNWYNPWYKPWYSQWFSY
jgi:hypothetical protein